jgi:hypothetical protein
MQVVSLNIRHGGRGILESLFAEHDPDVIAFSEWCPNVPGAGGRAGAVRKQPNAKARAERRLTTAAEENIFKLGASHDYSS